MMKMDAEIIGVDVFEKIKGKLNQVRPQVKLVIEANARLIEMKVKEKVPVDTGDLKRSITARPEHDDVEISWLIVSDKPYAEAQEFNEWYHHPSMAHQAEIGALSDKGTKGAMKRISRLTTQVGGPHFFRDSMTEVFPKYRSELENIMRSV